MVSEVVLVPMHVLHHLVVIVFHLIEVEVVVAFQLHLLGLVQLLQILLHLNMRVKVEESLSDDSNEFHFVE